MGQERLTREAMIRFQELGLPLYLLSLGEFRDHFFVNGWILLVRNRGDVTQVALMEPKPRAIPRQRPFIGE